MQTEKTGLKISKQARIYYGGMLLTTLVVIIFLLPSETFINVGLLFLSGVILLLFLCNLEWGMYAVAGTCFFYGWEILLSQYYWTKNITYLANLNAPAVDFIATLLTVGVGILVLLGLVSVSWKGVKHLKIPLLLYGLFLAVGAFAALGAYDNNTTSSFKYLIRPMSFAVVAFMVVPTILIRRKEMLITILKIWFVVGLGIAIFGLSSLVLNNQSTWIRVVPYSIKGFAPLGYNHNMIAEALVAIIPSTAYLVYRSYIEKKDALFKIYFAGMLLMIVTALLTLSRAAWIALVVEALFAVVFLWKDIKHVFEKRKQLFKTIGVVFSTALVVYMGTFLTSDTVQRSNETRLRMVEITTFYFKRSPWVGYGPGMYTRILGDTFDYVVEHGEPLESHGFIQKILLEEGVVGLFMFSSFVLYILWYLFKKSEHTHDSFFVKMFLIMVVGEITFQLFDTSYFSSVLWLPMGLALVATVVDAKPIQHIIYE